MTILGETKLEYCPICESETLWEYIEVQLPDGVFGLEQAIEPESHVVKFWRCCGHMNEQGRLKEEFKKGHNVSSARYVTWEAY